MDTIRTITNGAGHRLDVVETGRRRRFSDDFKAGIVAASYEVGAIVTDVARRHGVSAGQIYHWRALFGAWREAVAMPDCVPAFVPVSVADEEAALQAPRQPLGHAPPDGMLTIVLTCGRQIVIGTGFDAQMLASWTCNGFVPVW
jgi:transposase